MAGAMSTLTSSTIPSYFRTDMAAQLLSDSPQSQYLPMWPGFKHRPSRARSIQLDRSNTPRPRLIKPSEEDKVRCSICALATTYPFKDAESLPHDYLGHGVRTPITTGTTTRMKLPTSCGPWRFRSGPRPLTPLLVGCESIRHDIPPSYLGQT